MRGGEKNFFLTSDFGLIFSFSGALVVANQGMLFEIAYAVALRDSTRLRWFVSNASSIAKATSGKHLLLTSGAGSTMVRTSVITPDADSGLIRSFPLRSYRRIHLLMRRSCQKFHAGYRPVICMNAINCYLLNHPYINIYIYIFPSKWNCFLLEKITNTGWWFVFIRYICIVSIFDGALARWIICRTNNG